MNRLAWLAALILPIAACGGDPEPQPFDYCAESHDDGGIVVCDRGFDDHPRVHLPADELGGDGEAITVRAALDPQDDRPVILRDGRRAVLADAAGVIPFPFFDDGTTRVPDGVEWPSYRFLETVYEITGTADTITVDVLGTPTATLAIRDAEIHPVVRIAPEVLDGVMTGSWEGTLSRRVGPNRYDPDARVPIRVRWTGFEPDHQIIPHWTPGDGALTYSLVADGTIDNADQALTLADGSCAPALGSLGEANPIAETSAAMRMARVPAMHVAGDYQLVENGGMGPIAATSPGAAIQDAARAEFLVTTFYPHGTPNGMRVDGLAAVTAGGSPCTP